MVRYYGRARQITGAVNRNQPGLKMSGCPSRVGRSARILHYMGGRVNCNIALKPCGANGYSCMHTLNPDKVTANALKSYCWKPMAGKKIVNRQLLTAALAGGVNKHYNPRYSCKCSLKGAMSDLVKCN